MKKFDLRTHIRNSKGAIARKQPYRLIIEGSKKFYVRDGQAYAENGEHLGAYVDGKIVKEVPKPEEKVEPAKEEQVDKMLVDNRKKGYGGKA